MNTHCSSELDLYKERLALYNVMLHFVVLSYTKCKSCLRYNNNSNRKCKRKDINMKKEDRVYRNTVHLKLVLKVKCMPLFTTLWYHPVTQWIPEKQHHICTFMNGAAGGECEWGSDNSDLSEKHPSKESALPLVPRSLHQFSLEKGLKKALWKHDLPTSQN